jgi:hypothetical protein
MDSQPSGHGARSSYDAPIVNSPGLTLWNPLAPVGTPLKPRTLREGWIHELTTTHIYGTLTA